MTILGGIQMKSFVIKIEDFFKLNTNTAGANFEEAKRSLHIPLYQREYKWTDEKYVRYSMTLIIETSF